MISYQLTLSLRIVHTINNNLSYSSRSPPCTLQSAVNLSSRPLRVYDAHFATRAYARARIPLLLAAAAGCWNVCDLTYEYVSSCTHYAYEYDRTTRNKLK